MPAGLRLKAHDDTVLTRPSLHTGLTVHVD
jgi:hypothetical protein